MAATAATAPDGQGPGAEAVRAAHARLLHDKALQFDFSTLTPPPEPHVPGWLKAIQHFIADVLTAIFPALQVLFWIGLALIVGAIVLLIVREMAGVRFARRRRAKAARVQPADWRPEAWKAKALLEDADRLADEGRFDEAVHLILYRSIDDIEGRRPRTVRPALTARDIARLEALPGA
ncbi:MAG TPA: hypothetical protein VG939_13005, partial [Caulobacteraceae bacterium]|nr:hypothetical protein [Caulobacteraceae bacterium]